MAFKQIIIVEGRSDTERLQQVFGDIKTIETGGSNINKKVLGRILELKNEDLILFTDPDFQGERIRKIIQNIVPNIKQAFLKKSDGVPKHSGSLGIEHASDTVLKEALENVLMPTETLEEISIETLRELKLIDGKSSAQLRNKVAETLNLGNVNGKQFLKRLNLFGISESSLREAMENNGR